MTNWDDTHCSECGRGMGLVNLRDTACGTKKMCCYCADRYDNTDWTKVAERRRKIKEKMMR